MSIKITGPKDMTSEKVREQRLQRLAHKQDMFFHKSQRCFVEPGVTANYYLSDMTNTVVAVYADLDAAEEDFQS
jgi:hypothetical protein